jgi:hypothetical protein
LYHVRVPEYITVNAASQSCNKKVHGWV